MLLNYLRLAFRNLLKNKIHSIINIAGLGVASAFCILVFWYVQHERSFDTFHANEKNLYRLEVSNVFSIPKPEAKKSFLDFFAQKDEEKNMTVTPVVLGPELQKNLPEIEHIARIEQTGATIYANGESYKANRNIAYTDANFFKMFSFPLLAGDAATALNTKDKIAISESAAKKYFGSTDVVGKVLSVSLDTVRLFTVSAVMKDFPANSSLQYELLLNREADPEYKEAMQRGLNTFSDALILQLKQNVDKVAFSKKLDAFGRNMFSDMLKQFASFPGTHVKPENFHLMLRPFAEAHFYESSWWGHFTNLKNVYQLCSLALVILLIACLNYILLTLTGTISRSQEVGIRKTVGAPRKQIIFQFYIETQLLVVIALLTGFVLAIIGLPLFSNFIDEPLQLNYFSFKTIVIAFILFSIALGFLAGIYPALVMSGLKPLNMLRKFSSFKLNPVLSKLLVVAQFSVCIILIICALAMNEQMHFVNKQQMGFDKEQIVSIENPYGFGSDSKKVFRLKDLMSSYVQSEPSFENLTTTWFPYQGYNTNNHIINGKRTGVEVFNIDYNYFSFFKIPIVKGRNFSSSIPEDSAFINLTDAQQIEGASAARHAVVVNETLYNLLGKPALNEINREVGGRIIGVCKDYHADDFTKAIAPAFHIIEQGYIGYFWIKIKPQQNIATVMDNIKQHWKQLTNGEPFNYTFLDEEVAKSYDAYIRWLRTINACCILAIIIACMGLFGLSGLTTVSRIKEIGIRKVLGASVSGLFILLNKNTLIMALISFIVAVPLAIYFVQSWLQNFAYRITPGASLYITAGIISFATALLAVSYHTLKTALSNPVKSLRTE